MVWVVLPCWRRVWLVVNLELWFRVTEREREMFPSFTRFWARLPSAALLWFVKCKEKEVGEKPSLV